MNVIVTVSRAKEGTNMKTFTIDAENNISRRLDHAGAAVAPQGQASRLPARQRAWCWGSRGHFPLTPYHSSTPSTVSLPTGAKRLDAAWPLSPLLEVERDTIKGKHVLAVIWNGSCVWMKATMITFFVSADFLRPKRLG
jgi:hypothetical protein